jgi:hypothetical protein
LCFFFFFFFFFFFAMERSIHLQCVFRTIMKAYKLLSNEEKQEVTITTLSHLTYGIKSDLWYDVTVKHLRLVAAVSL